MPKDKIEGAIKRATSKEASLEEVVYEGYGPHGIAIVIETATDNPTRTVGNIRSYFTHVGGALGTTGSLDFLFERKGIIQFAVGNLNAEELELELIDHGAEEFIVEEGSVYVYTNFADFAGMQRAMEQKKIAITNAEVLRIPLSTNDLIRRKKTSGAGAHRPARRRRRCTGRVSQYEIVYSPLSECLPRVVRVLYTRTLCVRQCNRRTTEGKISQI